MKAIICGYLLVLLSGCVNNVVHRVDSANGLKNIKNIFVEKLPSDGRGVNKLIVNKLISMGYQATTEQPQPENIDAIITYRDKWRWDMSMYMLNLFIKVKEPDTGFPIASGSSLHASLTRKTPEGMANEVVTHIFYGK